MKNLICRLVFVLGLAISCAAQSGRRMATPPPPPPAPPVVETTEAPPDRISPSVDESGVLPDRLLNRDLKSLDQGSFKLSDFTGKVIVINLWASWCGPCRAEIPDYEKVRKEYAGRAVEFVGLTTEDPRAADRVKKFVRDVKFGFRLGWADGETARTLMGGGRGVIPQTLVLTSDGHIISHWRGYSRGQSRDHLRDVISRALAEANTSSQKQED